MNVMGTMHFINAQTGFVNGGTSWQYYHVLIKTINSGFSWTPVMTSGADGYNSGGSFKFFTNGHGYHISNKTYKTENFGDNWTQLNSQGGGPRALFMHSEDRGWLGKQSGLLKTTNGCVTWVNQNIGVTNVDINSVSFINSNTGWIAGESGHILKTTNGSGVNPPIAPTLISPPNNSNGISLTPILDWNDAQGATHYTLQVSPVNNFSNTVIDEQNLNVSEYQVQANTLQSNMLYYWRVLAGNIGGNSPWSEVWNFTTTFPSGIKSLSGNIPKEFKLIQNHPNPFNPSTRIRFDIAKESFVSLIVYDMLGRKVDELVNQKLSPGTYETEFSGSNFSSGVYYYKLIAGNFSETKRMVLIR